MPKKPLQHQVPPSLTPSHAISAISSQIERAKLLRQKSDLSSAECEAWRTTLHDVVRQAFGKPSETLDSIVSAGNCFAATFGRLTANQELVERHKKLDDLVLYLTEACTQLVQRIPQSQRNLKVIRKSKEAPWSVLRQPS